MKQSPQILDLTIPAAPEKPAPKPIQLVGCFQDYLYNDPSHKYQFSTPLDDRYEFRSHLNNAKIIKRLALLNEKMYPILRGMSLIEVDGVVFLGWWNDGVVA